MYFMPGIGGRELSLENSEETAELMQSFNVKYETLEKEQTIALALFIALATVSAVLAVMKNKAARE